MAGLSHIGSNPDHVANIKITCAAGFILSSDVSEKQDATTPFVQKQDQTFPDQEKHLITSNCQSSLQWINGPDMDPLLSEYSIPYENFVYLHSSQIFSFEIADPPRLRQSI